MELIEWTIREEMVKTVEDLDLSKGDAVILPYDTAEVTNSYGFTHGDGIALNLGLEGMMAIVVLTEKGERCLRSIN